MKQVEGVKGLEEGRGSGAGGGEGTANFTQVSGSGQGSRVISTTHCQQLPK